jgi:hypothetical protein
LDAKNMVGKGRTWSDLARPSNNGEFRCLLCRRSN